MMITKQDWLADTLYWTAVAVDHWRFLIAATDDGLIYVDRMDAEREDEPPEDFARWVKKHFPRAVPVRDEERMRPYAAQLLEYWRGERKEFDLPVAPRGTEFQLAVWRALREIKYGQTCSYAELAQRIGKPGAARAVGRAVGGNPLMIVIPCHRVIGKDGSLTGFSGGLDLKKRLLAIESGRA